MRFKILLVIGFLLIMVSTGYSGINDIGGFAWVPVNKIATGTVNANATTIWTPDTGKKIVLMGAVYSSGTASSFKVESGTSSTGIPDIQNTASGCIVLGSGVPIWKGSADETLTYTTNLNAADGTYKKTYSLYLWGYEE